MIEGCRTTQVSTKTVKFWRGSVVKNRLELLYEDATLGWAIAAICISPGLGCADWVARLVRFTTDRALPPGRWHQDTEFGWEI